MKITDALVAEHAALGAVFDHIERALEHLRTLGEVKVLASLVEGLLHGHGAVEQDLAYVALDHALQHKGQIDRLYEDHQEIDARLKLALAAHRLPEARHLLKAAVTASREHFKCEERTVFPLFEKVLQGGTLIELGKVWLEQRKI